MEEAALKLLSEIVHCPNMERCLSSPCRSHPCNKIVHSQGCIDISQYQLPEPWNGHISSAPLLYISSNPSISEDEDYPRMDWPEELIQDFFWNRFGGGIKEWVRDGNQARISDGEYLRSTPYWSEIKNRSGELLGRSVIPGVDYAITEIVHCKSRNNIGVDDAMEECVSKFFHSVLKVSGARVLISVGKKVERSMKVTFNLDQAARIIGPIWIAGQERFVLFFAAPNSNQPRKVDKVLTHSEIARIRSYLMDAPF